jgi:hypothetical protein
MPKQLTRHQSDLHTVIIPAETMIAPTSTRDFKFLSSYQSDPMLDVSWSKIAMTRLNFAFN